MKKILIAILIACSTFALAQNSITGKLLNKKGEPLIYATAVLLNPSDSTMQYYGISNEDGQFMIKNINAGEYIFQSGFLGYESFFKKVSVPLENGNNMGIIVMKEKELMLDEVEVSAARIPLLIKKDTVEYIADAFKTKPDASAEDLLKKMPGVEVDRAGNIKAQGESVRRVLVDGKEFFSNDPTVATKNLPADAIDKVQVYNKKSDETELTGIDDGSYSKTINMILKEGKKSAYFGDVTFGYGNDDRYQGGAKLYRFTRKYQLAALGMLNNINKFGFSFQDYLDFQGGLQSIMSSGGGSVQFDINSGDVPINFGQAINGLVTSGAVGLNYTHEARRNNRFNISYMGNGSNKKLIEDSYSQNYLNETYFTQNSDLNEDSKNRKHAINMGWRNRIDSTQNLNIFAGLNISTADADQFSFSESFENDILMNSLDSRSNSASNNFSTSGSATYLKSSKGNFKLFKLQASASYKKNLSETEWMNITNFFSTPSQITENRFRDDENSIKKFNASSSGTIKLSSLLYLIPSVSAGIEEESLDRELSENNSNELIDELSPEFNTQNKFIKGGLSFNRNTKKSQISIETALQSMQLKNTLNAASTVKKDYTYFLPRLSWQYEFSSGKRLSIDYRTTTNLPSAGQLLPISNTLNPIIISKGNRNLKPEYSHNLFLTWLYFDRFSSTSIFANANASYTTDKINLKRTIYEDLSQEINLINVDEDYRANANFDFSTPIRKLGLNFKISLKESWNRGKTYVNDIENINTNFSHAISINLDNRKKEKWDFLVGGKLQLTDSKYSIQEDLNKSYLNLSGFMDLSYTPNDKWYFSFSADITRYDKQSFGDVVSIPLLRSEISHYFLKNKRGVISIETFDLLDKNKGLERISSMNYLLEKRSNIMGRYVLLTFKYRLNKFDKKSNGITISVDKRR